MIRQRVMAAGGCLEVFAVSVQQFIPRIPLHDQLVERLRNMIIEGELQPGSRVAESRLCTRLGVSRTPLREALKVLSVDGLVQILPNKGATVVQVTLKQAEETLTIMGALEALAGELACTRAARQQVSKARSAYNAVLEQSCSGKELPYLELNDVVLKAIFDAADNATLSETHEKLEVRLSVLRFVAPGSPPRWREAIEDHKAMLKALEASDGAGLAKAVHRQVRHRLEMLGIALNAPSGRTVEEFQSIDDCSVGA